MVVSRKASAASDKEKLGGMRTIVLFPAEIANTTIAEVTIETPFTVTIMLGFLGIESSNVCHYVF